MSFVRRDRNIYMNKIVIILAFCVNCFGPLIREEENIDDIIKKFQEDDDGFFKDMPDNFMRDMDPTEDDIEESDFEDYA